MKHSLWIQAAGVMITASFVILAATTTHAQEFEDFGIPPQQMIAEAWTLFNSGQVEEALEMVRQAVRMDESNPTGYIEIAKMYKRLGRWDRAENAIKVGLQNKPKNPDLLYEWAHLQLKKGDLDGAFKTFTKVLLWNPRHESAHFWLGVLYLKRKETKSAAYHFKRVSKFDPHYKDARALLAKINNRTPFWNRFMKEILILVTFLSLRIVGGLKKNSFLNRCSEMGILFGVMMILIKHFINKA